MSGADLFESTKMVCKRMLRQYQRNLMDHATGTLCANFPARLASFWDHVEGMDVMRRYGHLTSKVCAHQFKYCADGVPQWTAFEYRSTHAWSMGLREHANLHEAVKEGIDRARHAIPLGAAAYADASARGWAAWV